MAVYLIEEEFSSLLLPQVHPLHGDLLIVSPIRRDADDARRALPDLDEVLQYISRVSRRYNHLEGGTELEQKHFLILS